MYNRWYNAPGDLMKAGPAINEAPMNNPIPNDNVQAYTPVQEVPADPAQNVLDPIRNNDTNVVVNNANANSPVVDGVDNNAAVADENAGVVVTPDTPVVSDVPVVVSPVTDGAAVIETVVPVEEAISSGDVEPQTAGFFSDNKFIIGLAVGVIGFMLYQQNMAKGANLTS